MTTTNDQEQWMPLDLEDDEIETYTALRDDVPPWLEASLWGWVFDQFSTDRASMYPGFNAALARRCERLLKITIHDEGPYGHSAGLRGLRNAFAGEPAKKVWRLVDFLLSQLYQRSDAVRSMDTMLIEAGSAWRVGTRQGKIGLVRRLPAGVEDAATAAFQKPNAGKKLAFAWEAAFGVSPDPTKAYSMAVKAVEDAAIPVVSPRNSAATLGTVIGDIRSSGNFRLPHLREHPSARTHDVLLSMLQMLWTGQHDRHGGSASAPVPAVTQAEAESAVLLAVTLVGWFESGHVQR